MKINRVKGVGHNYLDENKVIVSNKGIGADAMGRNAIATFVYPSDREDLMIGLKSFFLPDGYVLRYPGMSDDNFHMHQSRDHVIKAMAAFKLHGEHDFLKWFLDKGQRTHRFTPTQWLWAKGLYNPIWGAAWALFFTIENAATIMWNKLVRGIGPVKTYKSLDAYNASGNYHRPLTRQEEILRKLTVKDFAFFYSIFQAISVAGPVNRRIAKWIVSKNFERSNYAARLLCGRGLTPSEWVEAKEYKPTRSFRWSCRLNALNRRDMRTFSDPVGSNLELDLLKALLNEDITQT